ncbi:MAG: guanylate kinase [Candidatus Cloacimonadota bacterium]|nr:guanylate kinase [Candidatus Cloacimonadota bacterium]
MKDKTYFPIIISSPSGGGKSSVCDEILDRCDDVIYSVSYTTRPPRETEKDGVDYHFISEKRFMEMVNNGQFIEWANVHNFYYGTSLQVVKDCLKNKKHVLMDLDTEGTKQLLKKMPETLSVFLFPPSMKELEDRLRNRNTDNEETIKIRLVNARKEFADAWIYDIFLINDNLEEVIQKIIKKIKIKSSN